MSQYISFDHRIVWEGSRLSEHGSEAELCFMATHGLNTVICRTSVDAILNALHAHALRDDFLDINDYAGEDPERWLCERLFHYYRQAFRNLARDKIHAGQFALSFGTVRSILLGEQELSRKVLEFSRAHS